MLFGSVVLTGFVSFKALRIGLELGTGVAEVKRAEWVEGSGMIGKSPSREGTASRNLPYHSTHGAPTQTTGRRLETATDLVFR